MLHPKVDDKEIVKCLLWVVMLLVPETHSIAIKTEMREERSF